MLMMVMMIRMVMMMMIAGSEVEDGDWCDIEGGGIGS